MNIFEKIFGKKTKEIEPEKKFILPDNFEITMQDINYYHFMETGKTYTSPEELKRDGKEIDRKIEEYKKTDIYKILSTNLNDLDFKEIIINKPSYSIGNINLTLGIKGDSYTRCIFNPSIGLSIVTKINNSSKLTLYDFIKFSPYFLTSSKVAYEKGKKIEFFNKVNGLSEESDNNNKEVTFTNNVEKRDVDNVYQYFALDQKQDYSIKYLDDYSSKILAFNLTMTDYELSIIKTFSENVNFNNFDELSNLLKETLNNKILFISMMYGVIVIKGIDKDENVIYTSLSKDELTDELKELPEEKERKRN
ncbi:MAG: hypothetical protein IKX00_02575 [Bacilli bacterium]|nr:hypothetical protein [Bacilli bacterium]